MTDPAKPSDLELQILSVLWERGELTARAVRDAMPDGKERAYTTVLSTIQVMEKKGLVAHEPKGRAYVYRARVARDKVLGPFVRQLVQNVFGGSPATVMQCLIENGGVSERELDEVRRALDAATKRKGG